MPTRQRHRAPSCKLHKARGVSLVEALLALVVMALGMLAVAGVQANLRANADLSRQRAEAVRLAQESLESWRSFSSLTAVAGDVDYSDLVSDGPTDVSPAGANAIYLRTRTVPADPAGGSPPLRTLSVSVQWRDRTRGAADQAEQVELHTTVARVAPELAASLSVPPNGAPARQPLGRHSAIPQGAISQPDGTSIFTPPQAAGPVTRLIFNNLTGLITSICIDAICTAGKAQLLTGYLRMALGVGDPALLAANQVLDPPTTANALDNFLTVPLGRALELKVSYTSSADGVARNPDCFVDALPGNAETAVAYYCVIKLYDDVNTPNPTWTGSLQFGPSPGVVADAVAETSATVLRVCRYYDLAGNGSFLHVDQPLSNRNLLLIQAGSGAVAYTCPAVRTAAQQPV
jgi:hypothetical protein